MARRWRADPPRGFVCAAGITTTDVISGGSSGGAQNILLVGVDSRTDAHGNPLSEEELATLRAGHDGYTFDP